MSVVIKDIADKYGNKAIVRIHEAIKDGDVPDDPKNAAEAVIDQLNEPVAGFYHGVMGAYLLGHYYDKQVIKKVWGNKSVMTEWPVKSDADTVFSLTEDALDLSSTLIYCTLDYPNMKKDAGMEIKVDDAVNCGILAGKYKADSGLELLNEVFPGNGGILKLTGIKELQDDGYDLIIMITNSRFTGEDGSKHAITITGEINTGTEEGDPPVLVMPNDFTIGYYQYLYFTSQGHADTLFFYKLSDPDATAQAYERFEDGTWLETFILGGSLFDSIYLQGGQLKRHRDVLGTDILMIVKAENEFGVCIDTTVVHVGSPFEGITILDSAAMWYPLYSSIGDCYPLSEISSLTASSSSLQGSFSSSEYYIWRDITSWGDTLAKNSVNTSFDISFSGKFASGSGSLDYHRTEYDNQGDPNLDIQLNTNMTIGSTIEAGMSYNSTGGPSSFTLSALNSSANTTQVRVWHYWNKPDSTHTDNLQITGPVSFEFYGYLDVDYPVWK